MVLLWPASLLRLVEEPYQSIKSLRSIPLRFESILTSSKINIKCCGNTLAQLIMQDCMMERSPYSSREVNKTNDGIVTVNAVHCEMFAGSTYL